MKVAHAGSGNPLPVAFRRWISEDNAFLQVALRLPQVGRMRFIDIHHIESNVVFVLLVQLIERGNLPAKGRSSITSKNQHNRLLIPERRQPDKGRMIQQRKHEIRRMVSCSQVARPRALPHAFERK